MQRLFDEDRKIIVLASRQCSATRAGQGACGLQGGEVEPNRDDRSVKSLGEIVDRYPPMFPQQIANTTPALFDQ
jgi:hypothetical protein